MALNVYDAKGTIGIAGHSYGPGGGKVAGGMLSGTLAQLNADLATLAYRAGTVPGSDTLTIDVWNQAGVEATTTVAITTTTPTVAIPAGQSSFSSSASYTLFTATAGSHNIFLGGSHDQLVATGGGETVNATGGNNNIRTGDANDTIRIGGSGNVVNAGAGVNTISDSGHGSTLVLSSAAGAMDVISAAVLQAGDLVDLRSVLAATSWNGAASTVGTYLHTRLSGADTILSVTPAAGAASTDIARLIGGGLIGLSALTQHAIL